MNFAVLGNLSDIKGVTPLLRSWARLGIRDARLRFYGADPRNRFARQATDLGLSGNVQFMGAYRTTDMGRILAETDIGLVTSLSEGYPLTALEFMAHGVPFVITDVGAAPELTENNPDAILAPLTDAGVDSAISEMAGLVRSGKTCRPRLHDHYLHGFSEERTINKYEQYIRV